ncbi:hypothetical protein D9M69_725240 [compost metagenome]
MVGVCSIQVRLNSPTDSVTTISAPARMPWRQLGRITVKKRCMRPAPRLEAASSSVRISMADRIASTARTMKGSVNSTCPIRMKTQLVRSACHWP